MINFSFSLSNPLSGRWQNIWCRSYSTPFKNKFLELEVFKDSGIVSVMFRLSTRQSHSGLSMEIGLLGYSLSFNFYDNRHWNYKEGRYFMYGEEK